MVTKSQVNIITRKVRQRNIKSFSIEEELIDYISCEIEDMMVRGIAFECALEEVLDSMSFESKTEVNKLKRLSQPNTIDMLQNYLKIALRNLTRYKVNATINIFGLVISLTAALIIGLYLKFENSYDKQYPDLDRLYRVNTISNLGQTPTHMTSVSSKLIPEVKANIPEIEASSGLFLAILNQPLKWSDGVFFNNLISAVEDDFPKMMGLKEAQGTIANVFTKLNTIIVSETQAKSIFGETSPVGEIVDVKVNDKQLKLEVVAVYKDLPPNTHFAETRWTDFGFLISNKTLEGFSGNKPTWTSINGSAYVKLSKGVSVADAELKINSLIEERFGKNIWYKHYLQPISDIHLNRKGFEIGSEGSSAQLRLFVLVGLIIVFIACINYVNLTTAQASIRLKEVGVRKVIGARRRQFLTQFFVEGTLISCLSLVLALVLVLVFVPVLNARFSLHLGLNFTESTTELVMFFVLALLISLVCGIYPGWYLSRMKPNQLLRGGGAVNSGGGLLRKFLVTVQYITSITLIVATLIISGQMNFMSKKDLGFEKEQVVYLTLDYKIATKYGELVYDEIIKESGVIAASLTGNSLGDGNMPGNRIVVGTEGVENNNQMLQVLAVGDDFHKTLGLTMIEGRWFSAEYATDRAKGFVVNETFVKHFGLAEPLGIAINRNGQEGTIIGIVKDYHFKSMRNEIEPLVMHESENPQYDYWNIAVRLAEGDKANTLARLEDVWSNIVPEYPFDYEFLDDKIDQYYKSDQYFSIVFKIFSSIAILVSCLGLIGLVAFTTQRRAKEIGVRKVLGASIGTIVSLLSKDYLRLIVIAALVSIPIAYYAMDDWLDNFVYSISIKPHVFILGLLITIVLSWLSVSYLSFRAAKANPAESLRSE
ncbi:FtsX-like permease family protein [Roseivirga sp.]|uniref:ABC transporter permease n=1 Tax=Roseivirga sp. TaxID=1964215 RepID=UPI003B8DF817